MNTAICFEHFTIGGLPMLTAYRQAETWNIRSKSPVAITSYYDDEMVHVEV
jgi:hypothetical protein